MGEIIDFKKETKSIPFYYTNVFSVNVTPYDATIDFGIKTPEQAKSAGGEFEKQVRVAMSLVQAKTMLVVLKELLNNYERDIGEVPLPPDMKERYRKIFEK
jgi:hypothetical protein